jgi:hypothetical protein
VTFYGPLAVSLTNWSILLLSEASWTNGKRTKLSAIPSESNTCFIPAGFPCSKSYQYNQTEGTVF